MTNFFYLSFLLFIGGLLRGGTFAPVTLKDFGQPELLDRNMAPASLYHLEFDNQILPVLSVGDTDQVRAGEAWIAIITPLTDLTSAYHPHAQLAYEEAAWLYAQDLQPGADRIGIQHAAWALLDPSFPMDPISFLWTSAAFLNRSSLDLSQFFLVSSAPGSRGVQELLFEAPGHSLGAVPEPNGLIPVGLGFISLSAGLGCIRRKRNRGRRLTQ